MFDSFFRLLLVPYPTDGRLSKVRVSPDSISGWQIFGFTSYQALLIQFLGAALPINIVASSPINIILANLQPSTPTANANAKVLEPLLTIS